MQSPNEYFPMLVTESGIPILTNSLQYWNAASPIVVTLEGIVKSFNSKHL
jgi:phage-related protein